MSPVNVFRPRGFTGGHDHRFVKPFQPQAGGTPVDPLAHVKEAHAMDISVKPHAMAQDGGIPSHAHSDGAWIVQNAYGYDLEVYAI